MSKHSDRALELFKQDYNCSQAVFCAFCDEFNMDEETHCVSRQGSEAASAE